MKKFNIKIPCKKSSYVNASNSDSYAQLLTHIEVVLFWVI